MLADPVTIAAASPTPALVLAVVKSDGYGSERVDTGGNGYSIIINHSKPKGGGSKHYLQLVQTLDATNPYTGATQKQVCSVSMTVVRPAFGYTDAAVVALMKALTDFRDDAEVTSARLIQFQS
jgi:hypothetical protein